MNNLHDPKEINMVIIKYYKDMEWTKQVVHIRPVEDGLAGIYDGDDKGNHSLGFSPFPVLHPDLWNFLTPWS